MDVPDRSDIRCGRGSSALAIARRFGRLAYSRGGGRGTEPRSPNPDAIAKGRSVYRAKCQRCHGADGAGNGPEADPGHPPANLTDARRASRNPEGVLFYKIWNGRAKPKMPAMKADITRADVWRVIHYVKTLRK